MRLFSRLGYKPKHLKKKERCDSLPHILAPSIIGLCLCMVCLCGVSWAWFTSTISTGTISIETPTYTISYRADGGESAVIHENTVYTMTAENCTLILTADGTEGATGYCGIQIGDSTYYTEQIAAVGNFRFTVNAAAGTTVTIIPKWGSCAVRTAENTIANDGTITISVSADDSLSMDKDSTSDPQQEKSPAEDPVIPSAEETSQNEAEAPVTESAVTNVTVTVTTPETTTEEQPMTPAEPVTETPETTEPVTTETPPTEAPPETTE